MIKSRKQNIHGVLLLDKPYGVSSNKAIQIAKHVFSAVKCGHTGTLDPVAIGLLPVCFGEATKFAGLLLNAGKTYEARIKLGFLSTTGDIEGEIYPTAETMIEPTLNECEQTIKRFIGRIMQIPPMHSALKHEGKPLYAYARKGETIVRKAREIIVHNITIESLENNELQVTIRCGTGTYIRTLAEDIGKALGCGGAYLTFLRRTEIGVFELKQAHSLAKLGALQADALAGCLLPIDSFLTELPSVTLDKHIALHLIQGRAIAYPQQTKAVHDPRLIR
ncbi:MAG: tRNA pseudouridine(55) synthase TruB, partial [Nitrosomonas sp.]